MIDVGAEDGINDFRLEILVVDVGAFEVVGDFKKSKSSSTKHLVKIL